MEQCQACVASFKHASGSVHKDLLPERHNCRCIVGKRSCETYHGHPGCMSQCGTGLWPQSAASSKLGELKFGYGMCWKAFVVSCTELSCQKRLARKGAPSL